MNGGCLFKIHGSLDDPSSCPGALEHVGTQLTGNRAELLMNIVQNRPICFVGWRGDDPDIPPLLHSAMAGRDASLPIFWVHYEGDPPGKFNLENNMEEMSSFIKPMANQYPILTEADRAFGETLPWLGVKRDPNLNREPMSFDFLITINQSMHEDRCYAHGWHCPAPRRGNGHGRTSFEHLLITGKDQGRAFCRPRRNIIVAPAERGEKGGQIQKISFPGTEITLRATGFLDAIEHGLRDFIANGCYFEKQSLLLLKIPGLFGQYRRDLDDFRSRTNDRESAALHESLYLLHQGRLRFKVLGWLAKIIRLLAGWIRGPFDTAGQL